MAGLVLDASVVIAVTLQEAHRQLAAAILVRAVEAGAAVPNLWHLEVGNALLTAERRGILARSEREEAIREVLKLPVAIAPETALRAWTSTVVLADRHRLSLYDASYLELALRLDLPLASFDAALRRAAQAENVPLL